MGRGARGRAHDGVFPLVCLLLFMSVAGAFLVLVNAFVVKTLPSPMLPATPIPSFRCGIGGGYLGRA